MTLPSIAGVIRRRMLVNFRVDPSVMERFLPAPFRPKLHNGHAIAGVCLIRLEKIRPLGLPEFIGLASENAAHRVAAVWDDPRNGVETEGVYIPRRDTDSLLSHLAGGRIFQGEHRLADFHVTDDGTDISMTVKARDGGMRLDLRAHVADSFPADSCFSSIGASSAFFENGSLGYSATRDCSHFDGIRLHTHSWKVQPLEIAEVESSFFSDKSVFPEGSVVFDHALLMRDIAHEWHEAEEMKAPQV